MRKPNVTSALFFLAVIEEGSIAKAAAREHIVPSAVSKRLADLESLFWAHPEICIVVRDLQALPGAARTFVEHLSQSVAGAVVPATLPP